MHGNDGMATGCGKSLCMLLPPLVSGERAVAVISPLVGLMDEQVPPDIERTEVVFILRYLSWPRCINCMVTICQLFVLVRVTVKSMKTSSVASTDMVWGVPLSMYTKFI